MEKKSTTTKVKAAKKAPSKKPGISRATHNIDAAGQVLGRLATQIATLLRGKNKATYTPNIDAGDIVNITNASKVKTTGKKLTGKIYYRHSGYPGGLKTAKLGDLLDKNAAAVLKKTVYNMLPKNKLRDQMIKRLKISN